MRRILIGLLAALALLLAASQLLLPGYLEGRIEDRLTKRGGRADVQLHAFPAARLLAADGSRFELEGRGLRLDPDGGGGFDRLDGFDEVEIRLARTRIGPLDAETMSLTRAHDEGSYQLRAVAVTSARKLSAYAGSRVAGAAGALAGEIAGAAAPFADRPIDVRLDTRLQSDHGRVRASATELTVAGLPAGPLASLLVNAVAARL
jgi:hypothetical protein